MAEKVTFDGANKLIIVNNGETSLDAQQEIYSAWKRWLTTQYEANWLQALRTIAGDPIGGGQVVSPYFFLMNGWRIRPYEGDHQLTVDGNLFVDGGGNPFTPTVGNYNVLVNLNTSSKSITTTVSVSAGSGLDQTEHDRLFALPLDAEVANAVWSEPLSGYTTTGDAGEIVQKIQSLVKLLPGAL
jgi:hypothetical protein